MFSCCSRDTKLVLCEGVASRHSLIAAVSVGLADGLGLSSVQAGPGMDLAREN